MAKLHSKKHGKSGSKRPIFRVTPAWVEYPPHEVEELVLKLHKAGNNPTTIGLILRDQYGIPLVRALTKKSITKILADGGQKIEYPDDMLALIQKAVRMNKHLHANKKDALNNTKLIHIESKIKRLAKYYILNGRLPHDWVYKRETAALIVK
ncbi:30S ribosomal protein S15 [uncultured archaeon]|nr:30S ribosomal protein S15 [uncultured archaeon]